MTDVHLPTDPLRAGHLAAAPRTLVDVIRATASRYPDAAALDAGSDLLTYHDLLEAAEAMAGRLARAGIGRGDRVGVRIPSGTSDLYVAILGTLVAGAAYVPVDADDPDERARLVFGEADVAAVVGEGLRLAEVRGGQPAGPSSGPVAVEAPTPADDAWVIFTSGSTGTPKGVAVSHRSAAAFVDAEAHLFLQGSPLGPRDRVLAGLSVAFDASCEEMWLAWRHGACLVPAPRALVRSGLDLGPWLIEQGVTAISTVPTLASLWPAESLDHVRLLIFGGEACPPELAARLATPDREVWNTYGPTEATVVACGARMTGEGPVRIGLPLRGWDLEVVDDHGQPVAEGGTGELIIGGVGLARYLDPVKDAEKFAPMPTLGWARAYRSGDLVRRESEGLVFLGRADEQVKLGGRRIELGEVDAALQALPGVAGGAAAVKETAAGTQVLVGYLVPHDDAVPDLTRWDAVLREHLPAPLVPRLALVESLPTRTSGKVDRVALPWPLPAHPGEESTGDRPQLTATETRLARAWADVLGASVTSADDDFFASGGGSLTAARLVSVLRADYPEVTVRDLYAHPRLGAQAAHLDGMAPTSDPVPVRQVDPVGLRTRLAQTLVLTLATGVRALRWVLLVLTVNSVLERVAGTAAPLVTAPVWVLVIGWLALMAPPGRMLLGAGLARLLLRGVRPGTHPRGGRAHLLLWAAERGQEALGATSLAGAPWITWYARLLGARLGRDVDLHSLPPVTGLLRVGDGASVEPEVDLSGTWVDGDAVHIGEVRVGRGAVVGARSTLGPGCRVGRDARVEPGSLVLGRVPAGQVWGGSPATRVSHTSPPWPEGRPARATAWVPVYALGSLLVSALPFLAALPWAWALLSGRLSAAARTGAAPDGSSPGEAALEALRWSPLLVVGWALTVATLVALVVRLASLGVRPGHHPVRSRTGFQVWLTERLLDASRTWLFPLYASLATPAWLRLLGAQVGRGVEASTVLLVPAMTSIGDGAFLADDTMVASYELQHGWMRLEPARIGRRAFLGNSAMAAPGRRVRRDSLVAVLSAAPVRSRKGSSWLGSPPVRLRRSADVVDAALTFDPPVRLRVARACVELLRPAALVASFALLVGVAWVVETALLRVGVAPAVVVAGAALSLAGWLAAAVTALVKWLLVGRIRAADHPLWSSFVWRNELADAFTESVAAPWFAHHAPGTWALVAWQRAMGARIGRGVWLESYWLPEADLVSLGAGATVNRGCVVQTHLFHDRVMQLDSVRLDAGATMGPHGVVLPAATLGEGSTVGPASLVLRGELVPAGSRWVGNPIAPWAVRG